MLPIRCQKITEFAWNPHKYWVYFCKILFKLANKISSLYFLVLVLWFYLVLYVFYYPTSIDRTERCYQFVIKFLLSVKDSSDILIPVNHTINLYILVSYFVDNHIIFPYRIFIICPKADSFGEIRLHSRKHLKIFKLIINLFYRLRSIFLVVFGNVIPNILQIPPHDGQHPTIQLYTFLLPKRSYPLRKRNARPLSVLDMSLARIVIRRFYR